MTNGLWNFMDTFGPSPLPQLIVTTTLLMTNPAILFFLGTNPHMTPSTSGTQPMLGSTPLLSNSIPSTSATYNAPYNAQYSMVSVGPLNQPYGWHPLYSLNPPIQVSTGTPNMHILVGNVTVPPPFLGMHGQSLIDMSSPYVNQGHKVSSMAGENPQGGPNQSMGHPTHNLK